jgi:NADH-quinone oxidoreductase subunit H
MFIIIPGLIFGGTATAYLIGGALEYGRKAVSGTMGDLLGLLSDLHLGQILILLLVFVMVIATLLTLAERKWSAMMQNRIGPNRATIMGRPFGGLGHVGADSLKMLFKEDFVPTAANKLLFQLGPILAFVPVFALFAIVPTGPETTVFGATVPMYISNPNFGVLYLFAIASLAVYGTSLAGWASNNKFALLGGVRASSQMIAYEVALGLALVGMMLTLSTVRLPEMVEGQNHLLWGVLPAWGIFLQPLGFILFFAASFAETKRAPFDLPEGEAEIIGYFVEYSGMKFGMFMISEFVEVVVLSGVLVAVFLGGYHLPFIEPWLQDLDVSKQYPWLLASFLGTVFWLKVLTLCWVQLIIRWTFPRFRYDQIQTLGWKILLPAGLVNLFVTAALVLWDPTLGALALFGLVEIGVVVALTLSAKAPASVSPHAHVDHAHAGHAHPAQAAHAGH